MKIVAVSGWVGSGKDMVADFLVAKHGFKKLSFATVLKDMASEQYGIPREWFDDRVLKETALLNFPALALDSWSKGVTDMVYRHLRTKDGLQPTDYHIEDDGTVVGVFGRETYPLFHTPRSIAVIEGSTKRSVTSDYWVKRAVSKADPNGLYVISDARYKSEINQLITAAGKENVISLRINRFKTTNSTDSSERDLDDYSFDFTVNNSEEEGVTRNQVYEQVVHALTDSKVLKALTVTEQLNSLF